MSIIFATTGKDTTPALLGVELAIGAVTALTLTLIATVRRRRRELALLKTLGFTERQPARAVLWQSSIVMVIGVVVGASLGIVLGRFLWNLRTREIKIVPAPGVPPFTMALMALGALVLAILVEGLLDRYAARTPTALILRTG